MKMAMCDFCGRTSRAEEYEQLKIIVPGWNVPRAVLDICEGCRKDILNRVKIVHKRAGYEIKEDEE